MTEQEVTAFYRDETKSLLHSIGKERVGKLSEWEYCEADYEFVAFLENYKDLAELPKDFTIIDIGSNQSFQAEYFKDHKKYIGVEPCLPDEYRLQQDNAEYYNQTAQQFIAETLPRLIEQGLDLEKTFAVCSAVPDREAREQVAETFLYCRVAYPAEETIQYYPDDFEPSKFFTEEREELKPRLDKGADMER
jgi:hypothetical protein